MDKNYSEVLNESLTANGKDTSSEIVVTNTDILALQVDGDPDATGIKIRPEAKVRDEADDSWSEFGKETQPQDLTTTDHNSKTYLFDVGNVAKIRWDFLEQDGKTPNITAIASRED